MALFTYYVGRTPEPLGGKEADGFAEWLEESARTVRDSYEKIRETEPIDSVTRYIAHSADKEYGMTLSEFRAMGRDGSRDHFEAALIGNVIGAAGVLRFARDLEENKHPLRPSARKGGRPMDDVELSWGRACLILAKYVGCDVERVKECREDQKACEALRP